MDQKYLSIFEDNKSGIKTRLKYLSAHYPDLVSALNFFSIERNYQDLSFVQQLYNFIYGVIYLPTCLECSRGTTFNSFSKGYGKFCSPECGGKSKLSLDKSKQVWYG